jgi:arylsulfatase A-like enzyme
MNRRNFLKTTALSLGTLPVAGCFNKNSSQKKPNFIVIYADDMGYGDVGYHGVKNILTPNIDALAASGVWFSQGYVSSSVCGPSRAGLMTGVYQQRYGCGENPVENNYPQNKNSRLAGLPISQPVIPEMLQSAGYHSGIIGKWHLGLPEEKRPLSRGFDEFYGFLNGSHSYYKSTKEYTKNRDFWPIFRNREIAKFDGYLTDVFTDEAAGFIKRNKKKPFFLYLSYNAVHYPWEVPDRYIERVKHIKGKNRRLFAAMVLAMDDGVGKVVQTLKEEGLDQNTVVMFISDNGSPYGQERSKDGKDHMSSTDPLRGWKADTYEGGIRVPFIMKWPGVLPSGKCYDRPVSTIDIAPTLTTYLGIDAPDKGFDFDGVDLLPFLTGKNNDDPHEVMYWRRKSDYAVRRRDWKLAWNDSRNDGRPTGEERVELYNLTEDKEEKFDLSAQYPDLVKELQDIFDAWDSKLPDNPFRGGPVNRKRSL